MLHSRFSRRIFLLFLVCIIVPLVFIFLYSYHHVGKQLDEQNFRRLHQQVRSTSLSIYERLLFLRSELNLLSSRLPLDSMRSESASHDVERFLEGRSFERFSKILFQHNSLVIPLYGKIQAQPQLSPKEIKAIRDGKTVLRKQDQTGNYPALLMATPVIAKSPEKGLLFGEISPEYLWGIGPMHSLPPMTDLFVLDRNDRLLIASVSNAGDSIDRPAGINLRECTNTIYWNYGGDDHVAVCRNLFLEGRFSVTEWSIVLSQSRHDIRTSLEDFRILFPLFLLLSLLVVLLISTITIRRSLAPLNELKKATRIIASGKFDVKAEISSGDEFQELAEDFNRMGAQLRSQFGELKLNAEIGRHMASITDARKLADKVLESICRHLDFDAGFLAWGTPDSKTFVEAAGYGIQEEQQQELIRSWQSLSSGTRKAAADIDSKAFEYGGLSLVSDGGTDASICLPWKFSDQLEGILIIFKKQPGPVPETTERILNAIADELSVSLSNIYTFNRFLESEKKFRSIFENSAAGIALIDTQGRFTRANTSLCRMLGYSEQELMEKTSAELMTKQSKSIVSRVYRELQSGERDTGFLEESYIRKDGRTIWGMASHSLLRDRTGQPMYYIDLIQDISEVKQMREENEALEKQLQQAQKMEAIGTLAGGIAHDFNNILMAIIGYSELALMDTQKEDPSRRKLEQIMKAAKRASDLVKQILTFSRRGHMEKQSIQLTPLVKEALKLIRATFPACIQIEKKISRGRNYQGDGRSDAGSPTGNELVHECLPCHAGRRRRYSTGGN